MSARSRDRQPAPTPPAATEEADSDTGPSAPTRAPTTDGGEGRLTVSVPRRDVQALLSADRVAVEVPARSAGREYELLSLLRRADRRLRRFKVGADSELLGRPLADLRLRETYAVDLLAVRQDGEWTLAPDRGTVLGGGDAVIAVGPRAELPTFEDVIA